ncbi:MAG: hypothetical protein ACKV2T_42570 [Kofleriaceae bacterium]
MRTNRFVLATLAIVLAASPAAADGVAGTYDVKYEQVSTNCQSPLALPHGKLEVKSTRGAAITVEIVFAPGFRAPLMSGSVGKNGKISAKSKVGGTTVDGMNGVFSVGGKISPEGMLTLVMVGEYSASGKALCSQSWNVVGSRSERVAPPPKTKKSAALEFVPAFMRD